MVKIYKRLIIMVRYDCCVILSYVWEFLVFTPAFQCSIVGLPELV